jgi:hypothetical protein
MTIPLKRERTHVEQDMPDPCCAIFEHALHSGTDNEGYGALIQWVNPSGEWFTGQEVGPMLFCPWCGADLDKHVRGKIDMRGRLKGC